MRIVLVLIAAVVFAAACGASDEGGSVESGAVTTTIAGAVATTSAGAATNDTSTCGTGGDTTVGLQERELTTSDGNDRTWLLYVPTGYSGDEPSDVVFNFHGWGGTAADQHAYADFIEHAEQDDVLLVAPQGELFNPLYGDSTGWGANLRSNDIDIDFVHELVDLLRTDYCVGGLYATGMSAGGDMVSALACLEETPFEAFAPVTYTYYDEEECGSAPPRPFVYFHGTDDFVVPMEGSGEPWFDPPVPEGVQRWAGHNGCYPDPIEEQFTDEVTRIYWEGCDAPIEWYLVEGGGHTWPGAIEVEVLGHTTREISATDIIWDLFFA